VCECVSKRESERGRAFTFGSNSNRRSPLRGLRRKNASSRQVKNIRSKKSFGRKFFFSFFNFVFVDDFLRCLGFESRHKEFEVSVLLLSQFSKHDY